MSETTEVNGINYRIGKIDTFKQFHITRRLGPMIQAFAASLGQAHDSKKMEDKLKAMQPVADALAKMSDDDSNYILFNCLNVVTRETDGGKFVPIKPKNVDRLLFDDIDLLTMMFLTWSALEENIGDFFREAQAQSSSE